MNFKKIKKITKLPKYNQNVYDISMSSNPHTFMANNILVHNSCYFRINEGDTAENALDISRQVHKAIDDNSIPNLVSDIFNGLPNIMKSDFEAMSRATLSFGKKKQYAYLKAWEDGETLSKQKLSITGLSIKRTDSPKMLSDTMKPFFIDLMKGLEHEDIKAKMDNIEDKYKELDTISRSAKRSANNLNKYKKAMEYEIIVGERPFNIEKLDEACDAEWANIKVKVGDDIYTNFMKTGKGSYILDEKNHLIEDSDSEFVVQVDRKMVIPFHIKASLLYNFLLSEYKVDHIYSSIGNGEKIKLFYIKPQKINFKHTDEDGFEHSMVMLFDCIAFPGGIKNLPKFIETDFEVDTKKMLETFFSKKMENFFGVIDYDPEKIANQAMDLLF